MIYVIIPALNEEEAIARVIADIPESVTEVVVIDNGSTDRTSEVARKAGATVLKESRAGYGYACLKGITYLKDQQQNGDIIVFLDGDYSDYPEELTSLVAPIEKDNYDLVIGLHCHSQSQWLPVTAYRAERHARCPHRDPNTHPRYGRHGKQWHRRSLAL